MQKALICLRLSNVTQDRWEWQGETFSVCGAYAKIRGGSSMRSRQPHECAESSIKGANFWVAAPQEAPPDRSFPEEIVQGHI